MANSEIISAGIAAGGQILGGLLGKKPRTYGPGEVLRKTVGEARELGIHPLAALGTVSPYSSTPSAGMGPALADAAGTFSSGISRSADRKEQRRQAEAEEATTRALTAAQIDKMKAETQLAGWESRRQQAEIQRILQNPARGYGAPEGPPKAQELTKTFGEVYMPSDFADKQEAAAGDLIGGAKTLQEYIERYPNTLAASLLKQMGYKLTQRPDGRWSWKLPRKGQRKPGSYDEVTTP